MNGVQLAWEFLRRNPEYQKDFDRFQKLKSPSSKSKLQKKWLPGLPVLKLFDPKDNQPRGLKLALTHAPRFYVPHGKGMVSTESLYKGDVFVAFNLNIPIKRQLDKTGKFLEKERKKQKIKPLKNTPKRDALIRYLRILDAKADGNNNSVIGKIFYPRPKVIKNSSIEGATSPSKRAKNDYDRAKEYINEKYIF